ncbi:GIN domain-containing protein [Pedobacter vanadiisoli]|uniref:GIN domain-containing protein n=1 Tax=Pedobacter vanadiisoli TaxID=1761975 RepID=A0ABW5ME06_9SPHI
MKTSIKTLITIASAVITLTASLPANLRATEKPQTMLYGAPNFRKISIKGNVEVMLVQRPTAGISYADDNEGSARVTLQGEVLRITSDHKETCKLVIYVNDIYRIEADQNAVVKTEAKLITKFLQIILKGNAVANIDTSSEGLYTEILDNSALRLRGNTDLHTLIMGNESNLIIDHFVAAQTDVSRKESSGEKIAALVP